MSAVAGQKFDPANPAAYYAAVRKRLTTPQQPQKPAPLLVVRDTRHTQPVISIPAFLPVRLSEDNTRPRFNPVAARIEWMKLANALLKAEQKRAGVYHYRIPDIQRRVVALSRVPMIDLCSNRRTANIVLPRQIAMWFCKRFTTRSLPEIGRRFGGRDHTTVLHAVRKVEAIYQAGKLPNWATLIFNELNR